MFPRSQLGQMVNMLYQESSGVTGPVGQQHSSRRVNGLPMLQFPVGAKP